MILKDTIGMMQSEDFKERFRAEYFQLKIRTEGLKGMLVKYKEGTLSFKPKCSYDLLNNQLKVMELYLSFLEKRVLVESVNLEE